MSKDMNSTVVADSQSKKAGGQSTGVGKSDRFSTEVFGKWILAGEHAVLRGCPALVFPVFGKSLRFEFQAVEQPLTVEFTGEHGSEVQLLFWGVMERALASIGRRREQLTGRIQLHNSVPIGAGLGASATLCVGIGQWFVWQGWIQESELYEFSRSLENLFHGESSGVDIAIAISGRGLHFERDGGRFELVPKWQPRWYISYSGKRGVTSDCVSKVKALIAKDPELGARIDTDMRAAVALAEKALLMSDARQGFEDLLEAIQQARSCFERWGLADGEMAVHMNWLSKNGAVAVKPTGSGDGGYVLSLWNRPPPPAVNAQLISLQRNS